MASEFDIIRDYFTRPAPVDTLGVGDDCALVRVAQGMELAVSTDMLVSGRHFFPDADPYKLGHKVLAVNLSDLAAMGAQPRWATLALSLPEANASWLAAFSAGFFALAGEHGVSLIGGDTTRGPLTACVQIMGEVPVGQALLRAGARPGDDIWVSGTLGDAALALAHLKQRIRLTPQEVAACLPGLHLPTPRIALGKALREIATSAIDVSDGLAADLGHILHASNVAAEVEFASLPASPVLMRQLPDPVAQEALLSGGDDYELCFTAPASYAREIGELARQLHLPLTRIGRTRNGQGLVVLDHQHRAMTLESQGFDHFA
jgi:thiamine-monophosphate kinase